jgi:hypothetical protein
MAMQYDVQASAPLTTTGQVTNNAGTPANLSRIRIKGLYVVPGAAAGSVVFRDGGASGDILLTLNTPTVANAGAYNIIIPGEGILAETNLHGTVTNTASVVVFYG